MRNPFATTGSRQARSIAARRPGEVRRRWLALVALMTAGALLASAAMAEGNERRTLVTEYAGRGGDALRVQVLDAEALRTGTAAERDKTSRAATAGKPGNSSQSVDHDFWVYAVDVELFADDDRDGYFRGIDVLFDVDTIYSEADVYAVLYLSYEGGPWEEYAVTEDIRLFGATSDDDYVVVSDLVSGYPTGDYDLLIEIFDSIDDSFLTSIGPDESSELSFLPLEDSSRDSPGGTEIVVVSDGGGGAVSLLWLLLAPLASRAARRSARQ